MTSSSISRPSLPTRREQVLLVCPPVFSYHRSIQAELSALGYEVAWWDDRASDSSMLKVGLRLMPGLFKALLAPMFEAKLRQLTASSFSHVLVVKGEGMSLGFIKQLRARLANARFSLYFWDSVENAPHARQIAPMFDAVATFDPVDARRLGWSHRPLFARAESSSPGTADEASRFDWCFIGTLHSDRCRIVDRLRQADAGMRSYVFYFAPSLFVKALRMLSNPVLWKPSATPVSTRAMPASEVARICKASKAILDIEHPRQRGLTMRTIEALLSGRKLITTNRFIRESDLFDETRVHVISRTSPELRPVFFGIPFNAVPEAVRSRYSLRRWVLDLIGTEEQSNGLIANGAGPGPEWLKAV